MPASASAVDAVDASRSRSAVIASRRIVDACSAFQAMTGIITFSSSWPASQAIATVMSQPITWKQTWFTISGTDGFTLPGMIDEPGCTAGSAISDEPGARSHAEQPQVAGDLAELDRQPPHRAGVGEHVAHALRDAKQIRRPASAAARCQRAQVVDDAAAGSRRRRSGRCRRRSRRGSARAAARDARVDVVGAALDAGGVAAELLAERHRHGVLQVRAAGLQHVGELVAPCARALPASVARGSRRAARARCSSASRVAVGKTSLVDCPMLT